jgi:hypothetical protein
MAGAGSRWSATVEPDQARPVIEAVLACVDPNKLAWAVALGRVHVLDEAACMADAWDGLLPSEVVASSMAHGRGLDDLPTDVVAEMASKAADCKSDPGWWVDEIIVRKEVPQQLTAAQGQCVASRYLDVLGIDEVIRRRILGIHLLVLRPEDENALDLVNQCDVTDLGLIPVPTLQPGVCLTTAEDGHIVETGCDLPHKAEIYSVHPVDQSDWPGYDRIKTDTNQTCRADAEAIGTPADGYGLDSTSLDRASWERGRGQLTCIVVRLDGQPWTGPSGLVPTAEQPSDTSTFTVPPTTAPPSPTLPTGALPLVPNFAYLPWTQEENDAFFNGPLGTPENPFVQQSVGSDVVVDGRPIARVELHLLWPQHRTIADAVVLDVIAGITYEPGPQTIERVTMSDEQVLIRRIPTLVAWSWFEDGILHNIVTSEVDPLEASNFVAALIATQQAS